MEVRLQPSVEEPVDLILKNTITSGNALTVVGRLSQRGVSLIGRTLSTTKPFERSCVITREFILEPRE